MKVTFNVAKERADFDYFLEKNGLFLEDIQFSHDSNLCGSNSGVIYKCHTNDIGIKVIDYDGSIGKFYMSIKNHFLPNKTSLSVEILMEINVVDLGGLNNESL